MAKHESSVNYQNLIRDLAEMYPYPVAEVVVIELVANSLDAKANSIWIDYSPDSNVLVVTDNGEGMSAPQFDEYHDFAAGLKARGSGIGFAGVGAKISFNIGFQVVTETCSASFRGGSRWYLESDKRLLWEDIEPSRLEGKGTRVEVHFREDVRVPWSTTEDLFRLLKRHFLPLFDPTFLELYATLGYYPRNFRFIVNGQRAEPASVVLQLGLERTKEIFLERKRKRIGYGLFGLAAQEYPLEPDLCGVLLCTHGKVIKADLLGQFPGALGTRIFGLVEVPEFTEFLTTSKTDFIRSKGGYRKFASIYDPIRNEFRKWLLELGVQPLETTDVDEARKLERELRKLAESVPELGEFFGTWIKTRALQESEGGNIEAEIHEGIDVTFPEGLGERKGLAGPIGGGDQPGQVLVPSPGGDKTPARPISRTARGGPKISFVPVPERTELGWVEGDTIAINCAHPSFSRARGDPGARRIQNLFAVGVALQRFLLEASNASDLMLIDRLMAAWGKSAR